MELLAVLQQPQQVLAVGVLGEGFALRLELGVVLVIAFSLGLAAVLVAIGLFVVYARWIFRCFSFEFRIPKFVPAVSAAAISVAGIVIVYQSLFGMGIV